MKRAAFRTLPALLCALLLPLPFAVFNPDLARGPWQWLELLGASVLALAAAAGLGALAGRLLGRDAVVCAGLGALLWAALGFAFVGWLIAGPWLAAVGLLCLVAAGLLGEQAKQIGGGLHPLIAGALPAALLLAAFAAFWGRPPVPERQVVMIGLDGATWGLIDRFRAEGDLPTFDRLIAGGARAPLQTLVPTISPPIWTSIATGKSPEAHGIRDFWASSEQVQAKRLWEIADDAGLRSGVLGYLVTWPPRKKGGFLVPGWMAQGPETIPPELSFLKRIERGEKAETRRSLGESLELGLAALRHGVTLGSFNDALRVLAARKLGRQDDRRRALENRRLKLAFMSDVFCQLLRRERPHFAVFYDSGIDATEHLFFKYFEPESFPSVTAEDVAAVGDAIPGIYRQADRAVARIVESAGAGASFVLVSDHGQEAARSEGGRWYAVRTTALLRRLGIEDQLRATNIAGSVYLRAIDGEADVGAAWERLRAITTPDGEPLFELLLSSPREGSIGTRKGFDLEADPVVLVEGREVRAEELVRESERISGRHTETAMFLMVGPDAARGELLPRGHVLDVAPTVLALLGLPVARDMEGRVLEAAFRDGYFDASPLRFVETYGAPEWADAESDTALDEATLEQLKSLGYVE